MSLRTGILNSGRNTNKGSGVDTTLEPMHEWTHQGRREKPMVQDDDVIEINDSNSDGPTATAATGAPSLSSGRNMDTAKGPDHCHSKKDTLLLSPLSEGLLPKDSALCGAWVLLVTYHEVRGFEGQAVYRTAAGIHSTAKARAILAAILPDFRRSHPLLGSEGLKACLPDKSPLGHLQTLHGKRRCDWCRGSPVILLL